MAPPLAADNFGQRQAITTAIKNICQYYPPNTCLRELLQNADDAGATEIEYVLDTETYSGNHLLSDGLRDFQGPALLARNNSVFRDEDFDSLSSVGDSIKAKDPASTGKFGQGFNAVYHWTDGPWIYSRNWLLLLDPHEWWSRETGQAGGPRWDVVQNRDSVEIQNHLRAFRAFGLNHEEPLNQTVIRVPLRTAAQATRSKLFQLKIKTKEIEQALKEFGQEIKEGGLLFLKHVNRVIIRVDNDIIFDAKILVTNEKDTITREQLSMDFKGLYASHSPRISEDVFPFFELTIRYTEGDLYEDHRYAIQHVMLRSSGDADMDIWASEHKLFPWVAVAAQLKDQSDSNSTSGRLFTTLRLPMPTNLPLHVHGLFSIAPDRGRLSFTRGSDDPPTKWNSFMFTRCVGLAWLKLLIHRSTVSSRNEMFAFWPRANFTPVEMWDKLDESVIDLAINLNSQIWNACDGRCVGFSDALFAIKNAEATTYGFALAEARIPAVYLDEPLFRKTKERVRILSKSIQILSPTLVRQFLRSETLPLVSDNIASLILEFCLLDAIKSKLEGSSGTDLYKDFDMIPLWPTVDGGRSISDNTKLLLPRDNTEMQLFKTSRASDTLDISSDRLRSSVRKLLLGDVENITALMRLRRLADLAVDWPVMYPISLGQRSKYYAPRPPDPNELLRRIWTWIFERTRDGQSMNPLHGGGLWLVPMNGHRIRQYVPASKSYPVLLTEPNEPLFRFLTNIASQTPAETPPVFDIAVLSSEAVSLLRQHKEIRSDMNCACVEEADKFVDWLVVGKSKLSEVSDADREALISHLEHRTNYKNLSGGISTTLGKQMRRLPIYSKISCVPPFKNVDYGARSLDGGEHLYQAPADLPALPDMPNASFYRPRSSAEKLLVERLKALEVVSVKDLFTRHFLPWMETVPALIEDKLSSVKYNLADWLLKNSLPHSDAWRKDVFSRQIIPLPIEDGQRRYRCLNGMIDPSSDLAKLYDKKERLFPDSDFFARRKVALIDYGLLSKPIWCTPLERARYLSQNHGDIDIQRVKRLLKLPVCAEFADSVDAVAEIRGLKWLPGTSVTGQRVLLAPNECRGADESHLVDMVMGTTSISVSAEWRNILGWNEYLGNSILLEQLDGCIEKKQFEKIDDILHYMRPSNCSGLSSRSCVLGRSGDYFPPGKVFLRGSQLYLRPLAPYLDEVDSKFAIDHENLLVALKVQREPSIEDLLNVQRSLPITTEGQLAQSSLSIAISVLEIAMNLGYDPTVLLVPDTSSRFRKFPDIVHGEPLDVGDKAGFNFTHPELSTGLIRRMGIEDSLKRAIRLAIEVDSDDEEDFTPSESLETNIADTLERYSITDTFNEFLANADDAGATKILWILDDCSNGPHRSSSLLTTELKSYQGPALLVYNDGMFSENDFKGFKDIGQGGKRGDAASTGMFGRGALTMYHFTDVPMLLSNDSFVILDPQQQVLPIVYRKRRARRVGTKMSFSAVNRLAPDQLAPFVGLHGFQQDVDHYEGTMFRFPLRTFGAKTSLKETHETADVRSLLKGYFNTARTAILFLRHVSLIEFYVRGDPSPQWIVSAKRVRCASNGSFQRIEITTSQSGFEQQIDTWCVGLNTILQIPSDVFRSGRGSRKSSECGIAACLIEGQRDKPKTKRKGSISSLGKLHSTIVEHAGQPKIQQRVFCRLPTTHESSLPVSFHASFAVTGDRRNIALEAKAENSEWNQWLLKVCLSTMYLDTVQYLAPRIGQDVFKFWPMESSSSSISGVLSDAFWEKLASQPYSTANVLPVIVQDVQPDTKDRVAVFGSTQNTTSLTSAKFDFLLKSHSETLRDLLTGIFPLLVRPPQGVMRGFKTLASNQQIKTVDVECLRESFRLEENCKLLETFLAQIAKEEKQRAAIESLLRIMIPDTREEEQHTLSTLQNCRIVPRPHLESPMGLLIWNPGPDAVWHLLATPEEEKLFAFADDSMVHNGLFARPSEAYILVSKTHHDPIDTLLKSNFNVRRFELSDVGSLLRRSSSPIAPTTHVQDLDEWMSRLWEYLNRQFPKVHCIGDHAASQFNETADGLLSKAGLHDHCVYRMSSDGTWSYLSPEQFGTRPCIMQPLNGQHQKIVKVIPGLSMIDHTCAPFLLQEKEKDLECSDSFKRLLRALERLERTTNTTATKIIGQVLDLESKDVLKDLALKYLQSDNYRGDTDKAILRRLPIWRRVEPSPSPPREHVAANEGLFCGYEKMLMPWIKNLSRFVEPGILNLHKGELSKLEISPLTHEQVWEITKGDLPSEVKSPEARQQYLDFISYLGRWPLKVSGKIAPNGASIMCEANTLYDHKDIVFRAAFREKKRTHFLHKDMRIPDIHGFWLSHGLRTRSSGRMKHEHFLECILAINERWDSESTSPYFIKDSHIVAYYLHQGGDWFLSWPNHIWARLASVPMFKVQDVPADEIGYRRARMQQNVQKKSHRALEDSGKVSRKRIIWSQTSFLQTPPDNYVYESLPKSGDPTVNQVFDHLSYLVSIIKEILQDDTPEYLRDIQACYEYLQTHLDATKRIPGVYKARIWLNLDIIQVELASQDCLEATLTSSNLICLNSPVDPLPMKVAKKFLIPYEKLLMGLGCKTVKQPKPASAPQSSDSRELSLAAAMGEMRQLRDQNQLVDVYFKAEDQKKPAHRVVLSAVSEYCKKQFGGHWGRVLEHQATVHIEDLRFLTLSQMIDFAYTGDFEWPELKDSDDNAEIEDTLAMLLDLLDGTERWLLQRLHDMTENFLTSEPYSTIYVRPDTVDWVKERAEGARALRLVKYCEDFLADNEEIVRSLREDISMEE